MDQIDDMSCFEELIECDGDDFDSGAESAMMHESLPSACNDSEDGIYDGVSGIVPEGDQEGLNLIDVPVNQITLEQETGIDDNGKDNTGISEESDHGMVDLDEVPPPLQSPIALSSQRAYTISFGRTGDVSFDKLMDDVEQFNAECRELAEKARIEAGGNHDRPAHSNVTSGGYTYNTGDTHLDNLLNETYRTMSEYNAMLDMARAQIGPDRYLSFDDAIQRGGSKGLHDYIQQLRGWMDQASPDEIRQWVHENNMRHEQERARLHEQEILHEHSELERQFIKNQTDEQFKAEKDGYRQVFPDNKYAYRLPQGDPNIFEKDGEYYRLIPGTGGRMERLLDYR